MPIIPFVVLTLILARSIHVRGWGRSLQFFLWAYVFFAFKAFLNMYRDPDELPFVVNLHVLTRGGKDWGAFLLVRPAIRLCAAYGGFAAAEWLARRLGRTQRRYLFVAATAAIGYAVIGVIIEILNLRLGLLWWRWKDRIDPSPLSWFRLWLTWGMPAFLVCLLPFVARPERRRPWSAPLVAFIAFVAGLNVAAVAGDLAFRVYLSAFLVAAFVLPFIPWGPELAPIADARGDHERAATVRARSPSRGA
ncbi:MAG: hypothetical protein U0610_16680 [bacterium]